MFFKKKVIKFRNIFKCVFRKRLYVMKWILDPVQNTVKGEKEHYHKAFIFRGEIWLIYPQFHKI